MQTIAIFIATMNGHVSKLCAAKPVLNDHPLVQDLKSGLMTDCSILTA